MAIDRRTFLKYAGAASLGALLAPVKPAQAAADTTVRAEDSFAMLYDSTKCVGCRACQMACKDRVALPPVKDPGGLYEAPTGLSADVWTIIQLYKTDKEHAFVKHQCMHCIDPACVSVCPVAALEKLPSGPVVYHAERCIGCRYCMAACPFGVPKSEWDENLPLIQKCDFCFDRQANGKPPACGAACPTGALISGTRKEMLEIAHARVDGSSVYQNHVYGETEAGGTSMLYIAGVPYQKIGFPELDDRDLPAITWPYMQAVPAVIATMVTLSTAIYLRTSRNADKTHPLAPGDAGEKEA